MMAAVEKEGGLVGAYNSVFERVEKKYRVAPAQRAAVEAAANAAMAVDTYGRTRITSLYLDTPGRAMIARSVEKPLYKEKLRLRAYGKAAGAALMTAFSAGPLVRERGGAPLPDVEVERRAVAGLQAAAAIGGTAASETRAVAGLADGARQGRGSAALAVCADEDDLCAITVFFGIKKKFKGIVYKRRLALTLPAALAFVSGLAYEQACARWPLPDAEQAKAALAPTTRQIARELQAAMDRWLPLVPSMGIACDREAWGYRSAVLAEHADDGFFDSELRITFDDRLECLDCHDAGSPWRAIIAPAESIMEIKSAGPYPLWLVAALSAHSVYPASFTKYGNAYQKLFRRVEPKKWPQMASSELRETARKREII